MQTGWYKLPVTTENTAASDNTQAEDSAETATASQATAADQEDNSVSLPAISGYKYYDEDGKRASGWRTIEGVENISEDGEYFRFYFKNGAPYYGKEDLEIFTIDSKKYAFNTAGEMQTGKQSIRLSDGTAANYYFDEEGIMKTGKQTIYDEDLGETQNWLFHAEGSKKGQGYHGIKDNTLYVNGLRQEADKDLRFAPVSLDDTRYLVNVNGAVQKAGSTSKSASRPELGSGYKDFKDENDKETVVDINDTAVEKTEVNMSDAAEKDKMEVGENLYSYDTTQVESHDTQADVEAENVSAEENNDGDGDDNYNDNALFIEPKEAVSYKKPERADKHGKFGGDDYVSASESFNALNKTKVEEPVIERAYAFPPIELLGEPVHNNDSLSDTELRETGQKVHDTFKSFKVDVKIRAVTCGPTVTRYELLPEQGVRVNKITKLTDDIKLSLAAQSIRIEAPIPGKSAVGIEVPNPTPSSVYFRELLEGEAFEKAKSPLTFAVGKDISGKLILTDIGKMPHLLIAGATGSGKSVCINTLIMSILYKSDPNDVKLIMIDPKVVELSVYNGIPHLMCPVVTDAKEAAATLNWAVREMSDRYNKFTELGVRNIAGYNDKIKKVENPEKAGFAKMPYIVVIVDEFADLMMVASKDVEDAVCRLAQLARAAGIHLVLATQRPSVNVITGTIKANIPSRIAFSVSSAIDSRTILDRGGAEKLLGKGDMLFFPSGYSEPIRVQGAFVTDEEVSDVVEFLKNNNEEPQYNDKVTEIVEDETNDSKDSDRDSKSDRDEYFEEAGRFVIESDRAAAGQLQRKFSIGFNRAGRIIDQLHDAGVVGPAEGTKPRKVLMSKNEFEMMLGNAPEPVSDEEIDAISEKFGQDSERFVQQ